MDSFYSPIFVNLEGPPSADKLYFCASITHRNYHIRYLQVCKALFSTFSQLFDRNKYSTLLAGNRRWRKQ
ncbi:hypothetical protein EAI79_02190 [Streptococcus parasanguinis]|nr:hypothetical protein EAI79_02190 [Streptococcus parasanguinis]